MKLRASTGGIALALILSSCGGSTATSQSRPTRAKPPQETAIHIDGEPAQGDYVTATDASGIRFLVPASAVGNDHGHTFDVGPVASNAPGRTAGRAVGSHGAIVASATAVMPASAHVELYMTGQAGHDITLSWTADCGWTQQGRAAVGGNGGHGQAVLRMPAVAPVRLPQITNPAGVPSCYLSATAEERSVTHHARLEIIDY